MEGSPKAFNTCTITGIMQSCTVLLLISSCWTGRWMVCVDVFAILCARMAFCNLKLQRKLPHKLAKYSAMFRGKRLNGNTCDDGRDTRDAAD